MEFPGPMGLLTKSGAGRMAIREASWKRWQCLARNMRRAPGRGTSSEEEQEGMRRGWNGESGGRGGKFRDVVEHAGPQT